ncbi:MAG: hypothetical protein WC836_10230 [Desulfobacula sp.]|jgi:hypothetical protein
MQNIETGGITPPKNAQELLNMYYLEARSHLLETAAIMDRIERASGGRDAMEDHRIQNLMKICEMLAKEKTNRAEQFLMMLSV